VPETLKDTRFRRFQAVLADGSIMWFSGEEVTDRKIRAWITRDGEERIDRWK
jgi:hypothetical protein